MCFDPAHPPEKINNQQAAQKQAEKNKKRLLRASFDFFAANLAKVANLANLANLANFANLAEVATLAIWEISGVCRLQPAESSAGWR